MLRLHISLHRLCLQLIDRLLICPAQRRVLWVEDHGGRSCILHAIISLLLLLDETGGELLCLAAVDLLLFDQDRASIFAMLQLLLLVVHFCDVAAVATCGASAAWSGSCDLVSGWGPALAGMRTVGSCYQACLS